MFFFGCFKYCFECNYILQHFLVYTFSPDSDKSRRTVYAHSVCFNSVNCCILTNTPRSLPRMFSSSRKQKYDTIFNAFSNHKGLFRRDRHNRMCLYVSVGIVFRCRLCQEQKSFGFVYKCAGSHFFNIKLNHLHTRDCLLNHFCWMRGRGALVLNSLAFNCKGIRNYKPSETFCVCVCVCSLCFLPINVIRIPSSLSRCLSLFNKDFQRFLKPSSFTVYRIRDYNHINYSREGSEMIV